VRVPNRSPTDGWTTCAQGHRHWGLAGAAGLLLHRPGPDGVEVLLQLRVEWSHHGGTWGTPGGALHRCEPAADGALREAGEELGLHRADVVLGRESVDDHGGWSYTTVLATPTGLLDPGLLELNAESVDVGWFPLDALADVRLHPGLAASLPTLRPLLA
jgi:8-oxo-dGTP diphosphatase